MVYIYTLQLEKGKYYIGKTNNPQFRLESHFNSNGSEWTKIYKPIMVLEIKPNCDDYDEDKITRQYMDKYGIDNVRGGSFVSVNLDPSLINVLSQMSNGTNDKCFKCGEKGHFAKKCKTSIVSCRFCKKEFPNINLFELHYKTTCINSNNLTVNNNSNNNLSNAILTAVYNICNNGIKCKGCNNWDRCQSNKVETLYYNSNKNIMYNKNNEIFEKCKGKYNWIYHNTGKYLND